MVNIKNNLFGTMIKICEQEGVNFNIFSKKFVSRHKRGVAEIQKEYFNMINIFCTGGSIYKMENRSNYPEREKDRMIKNTNLCFEGMFRDFLRSRKQKYSKNENIWRI